MPSPTNTQTNSPGDSKLKTCKSCNKAMNRSIIIECDECKNSFHESCIDSNGNTSNLGLIRLCFTCLGTNQICAETGKPKMSKTPPKSSIPTLGGNRLIRSLRSRDISIDEASVDSSAIKKKPGKISQPASIKKNDNCNLEKRIEALEAQLSLQQMTPCKCSEMMNKKIAGLEAIIETNYQVTIELIEIAKQNYEKNTQNECTIKIDSVDGPLYFPISLEDKIADIERTIKEDRLLVEQLFIHHLDVIDSRLTIQDETINSCETLMELAATNDTLVQNQFADLNNKIGNAEKSIKIQNKILQQLNGITQQHNNTVVTHFALNKAYCAEMVSKSQSFLMELSENAQTRHSNDVVESIGVNNNEEHTQPHAQNERTNEAHSPTTQPHEPTANDVTCEIRTQPLRVHGEYDYKHIQINVYNQDKFDDVQEIRNCIGAVLSEISSELNSSKLVVTGVKYGPNTSKLNECTLVVSSPKPVNLPQLNRFLPGHGFEVHRK